MNATRRRPPTFPRFGRRWFALAFGLMVAHFGVFWVLSPPDEFKMAPRREARRALILPEPGTPGYDEWLWLMTPGLFLMPSSLDFSGQAWLREVPIDLEFEQLTVASRPLPFSPVAESVGSAGLLPRRDPSPGFRWEVPPSPLGIPEIPEVPLAKHGSVRVVSGLAGWRLSTNRPWPAAPSLSAPGPTLVRVGIDRAGEVALPPVLWESSGVPEADALALAWIQGSRFEREDAGSESETAPRLGSSDLTWGLVQIDWAIPTVDPAPGSS